MYKRQVLILPEDSGEPACGPTTGTVVSGSIVSADSVWCACDSSCMTASLARSDAAEPSEMLGMSSLQSSGTSGGAGMPPDAAAVAVQLMDCPGGPPTTGTCDTAVPAGMVPLLAGVEGCVGAHSVLHMGHHSYTIYRLIGCICCTLSLIHI